jgi:hypothetical protein
LVGVVNKQNVWFSTSENPRVIHEKVHSSQGPIFFKETVNSECCLSMLRNTCVPHLLATGLLLQTQWFVYDGARLHTVNVILDFLHDPFDSHVI